MKKIRVNGTDFIDVNGKKITPVGIDMVCKDKSLGYLGNYTPEDFKWIKEQGFNIVRFGIFWDGLEPEPGKYDEEYIAAIEKTVGYAAAEGICVYLDMHQDLYGIVFEDGAPAWATLTDNREHIRTELWSESYLLSGAVQAAFDNFWANTPASDGMGIMDHYIAAWKHIAERFADNEYVIGYDLMNEPFPGSPAQMVMGALFTAIAEILNAAEGTDKYSPETVAELWQSEEAKLQLLSLLSDESALMALVGAAEPVVAEFEENVLNRFYSKLAAAIRTVDKDSIIMLESNYFANAGIPSHITPAVYEDGTQIPHQAYAPHGYDILVDTDNYESEDTTRVDLIFASLAQTAERLALPTIVGEWGCFPNATDSQVQAAKHLKAIFRTMNAGDTYFDYSHLRGNRILEALVD